jgi:hypothetical protein
VTAAPAPAALAILVPLACLACAGEGIVDPVGPTLCTDVAPFKAELNCIQQFVFTPSCALSGCHLAPGAQLGLELSDGQSRSNTVGVPSVEVPMLNRIEQGDPNGSYLVLKIEGDPSIVPDRMPPSPAAPLPPEVIDVIRQWVFDGAPDN